jgi:ubiquinone biosynthesis protein COQ9|tara:strand:- start:2498 stop:2677 length:180 start_codon:yes stop_codon:yes gene_type:complete
MNDFLDNMANHQHQKMLREIAEDDLTPKKKDKKVEQEIWERVDTGDASPGVWTRDIIRE